METELEKVMKDVRELEEAFGFSCEEIENNDDSDDVATYTCNLLL